MIFFRLYARINTLKKQLLNGNQFQPNSSTVFAISLLCDKLIKNMDNGLYNYSTFFGLIKGARYRRSVDQWFSTCVSQNFFKKY